MLTLVMSVIFTVIPQDAVPLPAWIATLHDYEQRYGRDSWSLGQLEQARASVVDPRWCKSSQPAWWIDLYRWYLDYHFLLYLLLTLLGCIACCWCYFRRRLRLCCVLALAWLALGVTGWCLISPPHSPLVVIKQPALAVRIGNGITYPPLLVNGEPVLLGAGVEAKYRTERTNGWVQIELKDNILGWVPKDAVYIIDQQ